MVDNNYLTLFDIVKEIDRIPILRNVGNISTAYDSNSQDILFSLEDDSWWFNYRAEILIMLVELYVNKKRLLLDVGGGNGFTTNLLKNIGYNVILLEPSLEACVNCRRRGALSICGSLDANCVQKNSIPQVLLLDVLEHIEDDVAFLSIIFDSLMEGGTLLITVPASMQLWCSYDITAGHFRRYTTNELIEKATRVGFKVEYCTYFFSFLYPIVKIFRVGLEKIKIRKPKYERTEQENNIIRNRQHKTKSLFIRRILNILNELEKKKILKKKNIPYGSSLLCILQK